MKVLSDSGAPRGAEQGYQLTANDSTSINILKLWLIILVVFTHSVGGSVRFDGGELVFEIPAWLDWIEYAIANVISNCAVPAYFLMSAVLLYKRPFSWIENTKKKFRSLLMPYVALNAFWIAFFYIAQRISVVSIYFSQPGNMVANWGVYDFVDALIGLDKHPILYPLWFMRDLFVLNTASKLIKLIIDKTPIGAGIALLVLLFFDVETNLFFLSFDSIFFFCAGYYVVKFDLHFSSIKLKMGALSVIYFLGILAGCTARGTKYQYITHNLMIGIGIIFFAKLAASIQNESIKDKFLRLSKYSVAIYIFHEYSLLIFTKFAARLLPTNSISQMLQFFGNALVVITFCIALGIFMRRFMPKIYRFLVGNR
jgi:hypothetical protein